MDISAQRGSLRLNPLAPLGRSWRRLRRRPAAMQVRTILVIVGVIVALVAWLVMAPSGVPGGSSSAGAAEVPQHAFSPTPVSKASTSSRGVSATTINVAFPVVDINSLSGREGFASDKEYGQQINAIHLFVNQINQSGGINGRKINPIISSFDPLNNANSTALCKQWTEGSPAVFAVLDGIGTWEGDNQLCVTQQGQTPLISAWSTTTDWTQLGSPYLQAARGSELGPVRRGGPGADRGRLGLLGDAELVVALPGSDAVEYCEDSQAALGALLAQGGRS